MRTGSPETSCPAPVGLHLLEEGDGLDDTAKHQGGREGERERRHALHQRGRLDPDGRGPGGDPRSCSEVRPAEDREGGAEALRGAADANRTLILSVLNKAYAEEDGLLDLFMRSLREGEGTAQLLSHVLLVAMDRPAYHRCMSLGGIRCYRLPASRNDTQDLSSEQLYMSDGFIRMMWRRIRLLGDVLKHGYSFIFTVISSSPASEKVT